MAAPYVFLDNQITKQSRYYSAPIRVITAHSATEVPDAFAAIEQALSRGLYVAGFTAYELGFALIDKLRAPNGDSDAPLLCFGVFEGYKRGAAPKASTRSPLPTLTPLWSKPDYLKRFERLIDYIAAGDLYQANLTFPFAGQSKRAPDLPYLYQQIKSRQPVRYGGLIDLGGAQILSLSPELFFSMDGKAVKARPMKGTAPRSNNPKEDAQIAADMQNDEKSRAENLMIVDLLRNDLSRVSQAGSVKVTDLFSLETYPTLHQLTSGIEATLRDGVSVTDVFTQLFPCGSVTGAPKIRAMEIIDELEAGPRGPYCGAIGYFDPSGACSFNVAIRTLSCAKSENGYKVQYPVGSGVIIESKGEDEYAECLLKARIITRALRPDYDLIETLRWEPRNGFNALDLHMTRLIRSADELGFHWDLSAIFTALDQAVFCADQPLRIRLTLSPAGAVNVQTKPLKPLNQPVRICVSQNPLGPDVQITKHKVSARKFYDGERTRVQALMPCDEVIFFNDKAQLCEGSFTAVFVKREGQLYTPPLSAGLLPSVLRAQLIASGQVKIKTLTLQDLKSAEAIYVGNSLRGRLKASLQSTEPL